MIYVAMYLVAIVAANLISAEFGPAASIFNAFFLIALDLTARDKLHDAWQRRNLILKMGLLIASGSALSWLLNRNAGPIAIASFSAFALSNLADTLAYQALHKRSKLVQVNGSNVVSAAVDSLAFLSLAFGWPPAPGILAGQIAAKIGGGLIWSLILNRVRGVTRDKAPSPM